MRIYAFLMTALGFSLALFVMIGIPIWAVLGILTGLGVIR